jgi:hypothetical protein
MIKRIINFWKCEWEVFCFLESSEGATAPKYHVENKIHQIKEKFNQIQRGNNGNRKTTYRRKRASIPLCNG